MTKNELNDQYFRWMCQLVCSDKKRRRTSHQQLLSRLHQAEFSYTIGMDGNRAADGTDLRYRFGDEHGYDMRLIASYLDNRVCSILEMLVALSIRCEEHIMDNPDIGNRTGEWFWGMIECLGLYNMSDSYYDEEIIDDILYRFINREYERDGTGGLFSVRNSPYDFRLAEIWYQMCWYLDAILD